MYAVSVVVASHWPTPDEPGALFQHFYAQYPKASNRISNSGTAAALRAAQLVMLQSASWRARPRYWAAFYAMGKD